MFADDMPKHEVDQASIVKDIEQAQFCPKTGGSD